MLTALTRRSARVPRALATLLALAFVGGCAVLTQEAPRTVDPAEIADLVITNVTVIDSSAGRRAGQSVVVKDGQITEVVVSTDASIPARETLNGRGRFLIPGLWDMHVHITYEAALTEAMPDLFLDYGITSVRDTGGLLHKLAPEVARWRAADAVAPRLYYSGPLLDGSNVVYDGDSRPEIGITNPTPAAARASIKRLQQAGVDFVKIYEMVSPAVFDALVAAAREARLPIAAHVPLAFTPDVAGPQVDSMEHLRNVELGCSADAEAALSERRARLAAPGAISGYDLRRELHGAHHARARAAFDAENCARVIAALTDTIQVPTLRLNTSTLYPPLARPDWREHVRRLPEAAQADWLAIAENWLARAATADTESGRWSLRLISDLHAAGVPIGAGTDTPIGSALPGYSLHTELERLVEAGLTPLEALTAATVQPARFFGLEQTLGQIDAGYLADLVLLDADPLLDIRHTRQVHTVVSKGVIVRRPR